MYPQALHRTRPITAQRTRFDQIMLSDMFILKMRPHCNLPLKTPITNRTMIRQRFRVCGKMFRQMILPEESLLTHSALVRFHTSVSHLVPPHIRPIRKFHITHIALEHFPVHPVRWWIIVLHLHAHLVLHTIVTVASIMDGIHVCGERNPVHSFEIATITSVIALARVVICVGGGHVVLFGVVVGGCAGAAVGGRLGDTAAAGIGLVVHGCVRHYHREQGSLKILVM